MHDTNTRWIPVCWPVLPVWSTYVPKAEHLADNSRRSIVEEVTAHGSPRSVMKHFQTSTTVVVVSGQSHWKQSSSHSVDDEVSHNSIVGAHPLGVLSQRSLNLTQLLRTSCLPQAPPKKQTNGQSDIPLDISKRRSQGHRSCLWW